MSNSNSNSRQKYQERRVSSSLLDINCTRARVHYFMTCSFYQKRLTFSVNKDSFPIRFLAPFGKGKNLSKSIYINANRGKMTSRVNSARQTQPSKLSWFRERTAGPSDDKPTDKEGRRCYSTVAFVIAEGK
jgi:hypothetical protein